MRRERTMWVAITLASATLLAVQWAVVRASHQKLPSSMVTAAHHLLGPALALGILQYPLPLENGIIQLYLAYIFLINPPFSWISTYATQRLPVSLSKPLSGFASLSATLTGWLLFERQFSPLGFFGIVLGFAGLWLLYHARGGAWKKPHPWLLALCMLNFGFLSSLVSQVLAVYPHPVITSGLGLTGALVISGIASVLHFRRAHLRRENFGMLGFIAVSNVLSEVLYSIALGMVPAAYAVSTKRVSIILTALLGYYIFKEREIPFGRLMAASGIVMAAIVFMAVGK